MLPRPKKETMESKELNSKDGEKNCRTPAKKRREESQLLKDKQQVKKKRKKCLTQSPRTKKEKLGQENREEGMKRTKER